MFVMNQMQLFLYFEFIFSLTPLKNINLHNDAPTNTKFAGAFSDCQSILRSSAADRYLLSILRLVAF